jgi:hypothetical protein
MKAVHVAWVALVPLLGVLLVAIGQTMQGNPLDWTAIGAALTGIVAVFLPAAQLALPQFRPPDTRIAGASQGDMPILK